MRRLDFDAASHTYFVDGVPVGRSVTGVLKRAGLIDFSGIPAGVLERARTRGTVVHQALHYLNEGDLDLKGFSTDYPDYLGYVEAWQFFLAARDFRPVLCEHRVASAAHDVAGTIDCLGVLEGRGVLIDFATGDPAHAAKDLQTAAYVALAWESRPHDGAIDRYLGEFGPFIRRYAVALRADGTFSIEEYKHPGDAAEFFALVAAQRILDRRRPRRVEVLA